MMEVAGSWAEVFEGSEAKEESSETLLGSSTLTLAPLVSDSPSIRRSQPILITSNRAKGVESFSSSVPSIPNPFPELSKSPVLISSFPPQSSDKHVIKVYGEDSHSRSVWVSPGATAREACHMLVQTAHCSDQENWALLEVHPTLGLERCLEDHEVVLEVQATWSLKGDTSVGQLCSTLCTDLAFSSYDENLLKSGTCPEIQGFLHVKESSRKAWKKVYFFLRRSGLYSSTKGSSKEPRHLQYVADLDDLNVYTVVNSRKLYGAPTDFTFCIKPSKNPIRVQDLKILCAENEQTRTCWTSAFRLFKYGKQLQRNYEMSKAAPQKVEGSKLADGKSKSEASLVAMDFSGKAGGRVIQNPMEAQRAEREEGLAWRDDGDTLFIDLLQLVEFHQINKGILPVCLKHPCVCVAL
ncbi:growth factor receptor-bound protein 7-like [Neolamprologus brichardi]|uniref:growth factor receptor-bound protein 7-like n=1 Tax=Neolamprologus brichardi TaxID=32507 RepID=UPI0016438098|nr:growth factor receptor-bound protein 7-like [Neolamprologus brichardi]